MCNLIWFEVLCAQSYVAEWSKVKLQLNHKEMDIRGNSFEALFTWHLWFESRENLYSYMAVYYWPILLIILVHTFTWNT